MNENNDGVQLTEDQIASLENSSAGLDFQETEFIVSKDMGPQCSECTHYHDEHNGPNDHCMHVIATAELKEAAEYKKGGFDVPPINQRCPCKGFIE